MVRAFNPTPEIYKPYAGALVTTMPQLRADNREILTMNEAMQCRIDFHDNPQVAYSWFQDPITVKEGALLNHKDHRLKIVPDWYDLVKELESKEPLSIGKLGGYNLPYQAYKQASGEELTLREINKSVGHSFTLDGIIKENSLYTNPLLLSLTQDSECLNKYLTMFQEDGLPFFGVQIYNVREKNPESPITLYPFSLDWEGEKRNFFHYHSLSRNINATHSVKHPKSQIIGIDRELEQKYHELLE